MVEHPGARLVGEHRALQAALGCEGNVPSEWACYRFTRKLREHSDKLARCLDRVTAGLHERLPHMGENVAIDASDMPAYANGQRFVSKGGAERERFSDPHASWGHRSAVSTRKGGGFYGYRVHAAVCADTGLPLAWTVQTASIHESNYVAPLLDTLHARGFSPDTCALDRGYDVERVYAECAERGCHPIIPLRQTTAVKRGDHKPPTCEHGEWRFAGSDAKRGAAKWRCPTGECRPASVWVKASRLHPLIPRETLRWRKLYKGRASVEREFGRLKNDWALAPLRTRGIERVRLHADLTVLAQLSRALSRLRSRSRERSARPVPQAA